MPRKSDIASDSKEANTSPPGKDKDKDTGISIDDHTLPKSIVTRLAKGVLPQNTNVQKDAVLALSKGGTVFINYLCATANDQAKQHGRKTINPKDVLDAIELLEFRDFLPRLEAELAKFNEIAEGKRANNPRKPKDRDKAPSAATKDSPNTGDGDSPPAAKKMRVGSGLKSAVAGGKGEREENEESGDEEGEDDEDDVPDDDDATESDAEEEEEPDEALDAEAEAELEENGDREEDEALDNGLDSD